MSNGTPEQVLASIVDGINTGNSTLSCLFMSPGRFCDSAWEPQSRLARYR
jgi:hypothetical protein